MHAELRGKVYGYKSGCAEALGDFKRYAVALALMQRVTTGTCTSEIESGIAQIPSSNLIGGKSIIGHYVGFSSLVGEDHSSVL